jgi:hypothetical protein
MAVLLFEARKRERGGIAEEYVKGKSHANTLFGGGGGMEITFVESSLASPSRPSDKSTVV